MLDLDHPLSRFIIAVAREDDVRVPLLPSAVPMRKHAYHNS